MKTCKYGCGKMKEGGKVTAIKKMAKGGMTQGKCPFGECWDKVNEVCKSCPSSTYGTLGAASGALAVGAKMIGSAIKKGQAKRQAKKESNKTIDSAMTTAKKASVMKTGGSMKKMQMGGSMGIVGMPQYTNNPRTDAGHMLKKGGTVAVTNRAVSAGCRGGMIKDASGKCVNERKFKSGGTVNKKFAALAPPFNKATAADRIAGAKKNATKKK